MKNNSTDRVCIPQNAHLYKSRYPEIGRLLKEMDESSKLVHEQFALSQKHIEIKNFFRSLKAYQNLEDILSEREGPPFVDAGIFSKFYSVLAFRMIDTSMQKDNIKFSQIHQILKDSEDLSKGTEPSYYAVHYYYNKKLAELEKSGGKKATHIIGKYFDKFREIYMNEYVSLLIGTKWSVRGLYRPNDSAKYFKQNKIKSLLVDHAKDLGGMAFHAATQLAFLFGIVSGISYFSKGAPAMGVFALALGMTPAVTVKLYENNRISEILGPEYQMPKLIPVKLSKSNNYGSLLCQSKLPK